MFPKIPNYKGFIPTMYQYRSCNTHTSCRKFHFLIFLHYNSLSSAVSCVYSTLKEIRSCPLSCSFTVSQEFTPLSYYPIHITPISGGADCPTTTRTSNNRCSPQLADLRCSTSEVFARLTYPDLARKLDYPFGSSQYMAIYLFTIS